MIRFVHLPARVFDGRRPGADGRDLLLIGERSVVLNGCDFVLDAGKRRGDCVKARLVSVGGRVAAQLAQPVDGGGDVLLLRPHAPEEVLHGLVNVRQVRNRRRRGRHSLSRGGFRRRGRDCLRHNGRHFGLRRRRQGDVRLREHGFRACEGAFKAFLFGKRLCQLRLRGDERRLGLVRPRVCRLELARQRLLVGLGLGEILLRHLKRGLGAGEGRLVGLRLGEILLRGGERRLGLVRPRVRRLKLGRKCLLIGLRLGQGRLRGGEGRDSVLRIAVRGVQFALPIVETELERDRRDQRGKQEQRKHPDPYLAFSIHCDALPISYMRIIP